MKSPKNLVKGLLGACAMLAGIAIGEVVGLLLAGRSQLVAVPGIDPRPDRSGRQRWQRWQVSQLVLYARKREHEPQQWFRCNGLLPSARAAAAR